MCLVLEALLCCDHACPVHSLQFQLHVVSQHLFSPLSSSGWKAVILWREYVRSCVSFWTRQLERTKNKQVGNDGKRDVMRKLLFDSLFRITFY